MDMFLSVKVGWVEINLVQNECRFIFALESHSQTAKAGDTNTGYAV